MRLWSLLMSALTLCLLMPPSLTIAQTAAPSQPSPQVEVVYILDHNQVITYDVDPDTGIPTRQGSLALVPFFPTIIPSIDDHYLYVTGTEKGVWQLWAYATDASGSPQNPPIQTLTFKSGTWNFTPHPNGRFAYAAQLVRNSQGQNVTGIRFFKIDSSTGHLIESPKMLDTYPLNGPCQSGESGGFGLLGFNPGGNQLNEVWYCSGFRSSTSYYYTRKVDQQTGALGPDVQTITANTITGGPFSEVSVTPKAILDYFIQADYFNNTLYVYPPTGGTTPIFSCTSAMLEACGDSFSEAVDPSGTYIFFYTPNGTGIAKLDLAAKQIVETGNSIPAGSSVEAFSPDEKLIYTRGGSIAFTYPIYVFDLATGVASTGGSISVPGSSLSPSIVPALRK